MGERLRRSLPDFMAMLAAVFVVAASLVPVSTPLDLALPNEPDKIGHFASYFALSFCALYRRYTFGDSSVTAAAIISLGDTIEMVQKAFDRTPEVNDFLANCAGVCVAWIAVVAVRHLRQKRSLESGAKPGT